MNKDRLKQFLPADVFPVDEIDQMYAKELLGVTSGKQLERFIYKWEYWLDRGTWKLKEADWEWIQPLLVIIRSEKKMEKVDRFTPQFRQALALAVPDKLLMVRLVAMKFKVPWGLAYKRMKQEGVIKY
jgi:hypothetical protein